jgi:hypothetical protein
MATEVEVHRRSVVVLAVLPGPIVPDLAILVIRECQAWPGLGVMAQIMAVALYTRVDLVVAAAVDTLAVAAVALVLAALVEMVQEVQAEEALPTQVALQVVLQLPVCNPATDKLSYNMPSHQW